MTLDEVPTEMRYALSQPAARNLAAVWPVLNGTHSGGKRKAMQGRSQAVRERQWSQLAAVSPVETRRFATALIEGGICLKNGTLDPRARWFLDFMNTLSLRLPKPSKRGR